MIAHGSGLTLYRFILTVKADSDFTIYCLLDQLERWRGKTKDNEFPDVWYIQVDGGFENTSKYLCAALELLVYIYLK